MRRKTRPLPVFHGNSPNGLTGASESSNERGISYQTSVRGNAAKSLVGPLREKGRPGLRNHATTTSDHYFQHIPMLHLHKSLRLPNFFVPLHIGLLASTQLSAKGLKATKSNDTITTEMGGRHVTCFRPLTQPSISSYVRKL